MADSKGQSVLDRWVAFVDSNVVLPAEFAGQSLVVALWCMHTWLVGRFNCTPFLDIAAPTSESGKTLLLEVVAVLSRGAKIWATLRPLMLVRWAEAKKGLVTCCIDEAEKLSSEAVGDTRSLLATGAYKGAMHGVSSGKSYTEYNVYFPKCFAQIGDIQKVLRSRAIQVDIYRSGSAPSNDFRGNKDAAEVDAAVLVGDFQALDWTNMIVEAPEFLSGRERELWTPIFSIAKHLKVNARTMAVLQAASIDMGARKLLPERKFSSAVDERSAEDRTHGEKLIRDLRAVLREGESAIMTATAVDRLRAIPTAPWRSFRGSEGLTQNELTALTAPFGLDKIEAWHKGGEVVDKASRKDRKMGAVKSGKAFSAASIVAAFAKLEGGV